MTGSPRILLVDDDTAIQRATAPLLRSYGYDVEVAGTAAEALKSFVGRQPDVVILDLGLAKLEEVVLEAGSHDQSVKMRTSDLLTLSGAEVADISI